MTILEMTPTNGPHKKCLLLMPAKIIQPKPKTSQFWRRLLICFQYVSIILRVDYFPSLILQLLKKYPDKIFISPAQ